MRYATGVSDLKSKRILGKEIKTRKNLILVLTSFLKILLYLKSDTCKYIARWKAKSLGCTLILTTQKSSDTKTI
jgi:hypothetical protein